MGPISFAESFYGPTYHIKDFSMQFIGHFLKYLVKKDETNDAVCLFHSFVIVPHLRRSGRNGQRYRCFHASWSRIGGLPRERLLHLPSQQDRLYPGARNDQQRVNQRIQPVHGGTICSYCQMQNSGISEVLRITRDLVTNNVHRDRIHIIAANSGHIVRVLCELPILFYAYFHSVEYPRKVAFSSYIANLKSTYALCLARDMGLPIDRVVLSCRPNSTVLDFFNTGEYQASLRNDPCKEEFLFVHSNMER